MADGKKKSSPEKNVYDKYMKDNPLFKGADKIQKHLKDKLEKKKKARRRPEFSPGLVQPPRRGSKFGKKPRNPAAPAISTRKRNDRGNERSIDLMKERIKKRSNMMKEGGMVIVDRNYLKGK